MRVQQLGFYQVKFFLQLIVLELQLNNQRTILVFGTHSDICLQELHSAFVVLNQFFLLSFVNLGHVFNLPFDENLQPVEDNHLAFIFAGGKDSRPNAGRRE